MAWEQVEWACGHNGRMQLYGKMSGRYSRTAWEAGRNCLACWLMEQWSQKNDPRGKREDRGFSLACDIAEGKGIRIYPKSEPEPEPEPEPQPEANQKLLEECADQL